VFYVNDISPWTVGDRVTVTARPNEINAMALDGSNAFRALPPGTPAVVVDHQIGQFVDVAVAVGAFRGRFRMISNRHLSLAEL